MSNYEINIDTLALISLKEKTRVYENKKVFVVNKSANKIIEDSCNYFGSSLSGRQKGTTNLIGISYKCPIIIEESKRIIFFPTHSPRLLNCSWISVNNIDKYYRGIDGNTVIKFKNGQKIRLSSSFGIIDNQILRSTRLESVLSGRINQKTFN